MVLRINELLKYAVKHNNALFGSAPDKEGFIKEQAYGPAAEVISALKEWEVSSMKPALLINELSASSTLEKKEKIPQVKGFPSKPSNSRRK